MSCDCRQRLLDAARDLLREADRPRANKTFIAARANAYGAAAGYLAKGDRMTAQTDTFASVTPEIERDRYGRPMIVPPGGGKKVPYRRCTTFVGVLEDTWNLSRWSQRNVAIGLADRPDLLLGVAAHRDDKQKLNQLCEDAAEAAKAHAAATTGTALHALTEIVDRGLDMPVLPEQAQLDIAAYRAATANIEWLAIEQGIVVDELRVHGTPDRVGRLPDGRVVIADLKTGNVDFGMAKIAMQMAVYSRGVPYDHASGRRDTFTAPVDQAAGIVIHLPAGTGKCELLEVDLAAGWEGVQIARQVWDWRARKNLAKPYGTGLDLFGLIDLAGDPDSVRALWAAHQSEWTEAHTAAAKARIDVLAAPAA